MLDDEDFIRGYTDADIEQAEFEEEGRRLSADLKRGICHHGWRQGGGRAKIAVGLAAITTGPAYRGRKGFEDAAFPDPSSVLDGHDVCLDCGAVVEARN